MIHIAIIPDGNRRWAEDRGLPPWKGHEKSAENFETMLEWGQKSGRISTLTFWAFSTANWNREPEEVNTLMQILEKYLKEKRKKFLEHGVRFLHSGRKDRLPASLRALIEDIERESGKTLGSFGRNGTYAGQFHWINAVVMDSKGNIYTGEVEENKRIQKFVPVMR